MKKKYLISVLVGVVVGAIMVAIIATVFKYSVEGQLNVYFYVVASVCFVAAVAGAVLMRYFLEKRNQSPESKSTFSSEKKYISSYQGQTVAVIIDFNRKIFASNELELSVIPFTKVVGGSIQVQPHPQYRDNCIVKYVIEVMCRDDMSHDNIELFHTMVDSKELGENNSLTEQMFDKYPRLNDILNLHEDVSKILEMNQQDFNDDPHYTKPPFSNNRW